MVSSSDTSNKNGATAVAAYGSIPVITTTTMNVSSEDETPTRRSSSRRRVGVVTSFLVAVTALCVLLLQKDCIRFSSSSSTSASSELELELIQVQDNQVQQDNQGVSFLLDKKYDATALYYDDQQVDHLHVDDGRVYSQRYYKLSNYWKGPGHPILVIMGGEAELTLPMLYPFVHDGLAKEFGAFVISPEHRFYGKSQPVKSGYPTVQEMSDYLSPDQALEDAIQLITYIRNEIGCNPDKTNSNYCPIITFGGSYPGFLSAMLRFRYPDIIDISYASSAPLELYSQKVNSDAYYNKVTEVAEISSTGCANAVKTTLFHVRDELYSTYTGDDDVLAAAGASGFCTNTFPTYIQNIEEFISETITYLVPAIFADFNMAYYPPGPTTALERACQIFQQSDETTNPLQRLNQFFELRGEIEYGTTDKKVDCFDLSQELPDGVNSKIRGSDNSGTGGGHEGEIWEFQCCKDLIIRAGYSEDKSMFLPRHFSYKWHKQHCEERFPGIQVDPYRMANEWGFDDLTKTSKIIFANGMRDGWSTSSITNITLANKEYDNIHIINFPNGAHHSELQHGIYPNPTDTPDIVHGYKETTDVLTLWLDEIYSLQIN